MRRRGKRPIDCSFKSTRPLGIISGKVLIRGLELAAWGRVSLTRAGAHGSDRRRSTMYQAKWPALHAPRAAAVRHLRHDVSRPEGGTAHAPGVPSHDATQAPVPCPADSRSGSGARASTYREDSATGAMVYF